VFQLLKNKKRKSHLQKKKFLKKVRKGKIFLDLNQDLLFLMVVSRLKKWYSMICLLFIQRM
jgi:hypothetical protein